MTWSPRYATYLSRSWLAEHVDLNTRIWERVSGDCNLVVDAQQDTYYLNRIEAHIRRCDLFLAILTARQGADAPAASPYVTFEIRLAERADKPRLVLYDPASAFEPGTRESDRVRYVAFDAAVLNEQVWSAVDGWLDGVRLAGPPARRTLTGESRGLAVTLVSAQHGPLALQAVHAALRESGFLEIVDITADATDVHALDAFRACDLLVASVDQPELWGFYSMAHAMFVPTIRLAGTDAADLSRLPRMLRHYSAGFQQDLVTWDDTASLQHAVSQRATACAVAVPTIADKQVALALLRQLPA